MNKGNQNNNKETSNSDKTGYSHLKWPAIILIIIVILLIVLLDYFYRVGEI